MLGQFEEKTPSGDLSMKKVLRLTKNEFLVLVNKDLTRRSFQTCSPELEINSERGREHNKYI